MYFENHPNAKRIFDYFQNKYRLGAVGLWHVYGVASLHNKSDKVVLSSMVIAPAGMFKSSIMNDIIKVSPKETFRVPDQPTDRGIVTLFKGSQGSMQNKMWTIEDAVTCFPSLEDTRQNRLIGLFVKVLMDGEYSYADFSTSQKLEARAGLYVNVADQNFLNIKDILKESTFLERVIPFRYFLGKKDEAKVVRNFRRVKYSKPPKVKLKNFTVDIPETLDDELDILINVVGNNCEMSLSRSNMFTCIILRSISLLEGRSVVTTQDIEFFRAVLLPYLTALKPLSTVERALILMLSLNRKARFEECVEFFTSDVCKNQYPYEYEDFVKVPLRELKDSFTHAKKLISGEEKAREIIGGISGKDGMLLGNNQSS